MWEVTRHLLHRGNSVQRLLTSAAAAFVAVLFLLIFVSQSAFAAGNASWNGNNLSYEGNTYSAKTANGSTPPGLSKDEPYYEYQSVNGDGTGNENVIYFSSGKADTGATSAKYEQFKLDTSGNYASKSPVAGPSDIPVTPKSLNATSTQAVWSGNSLKFDGKTFTGSNGGPIVADGKSAPNLPSGTQYYQALGNPDVSGNSTLYVVYFAKGVDVATATSADYATYHVDTSGVTGSQIGSSKKITVVPQANSPPASGAANGTSSCNVTGGIGWAICPVSNFLASGMDNIFGLLKGFLMVSPISTQTDAPLYQAWNLIRGFANVAFVIVFLVIIYSQLTGAGINNYGLKKLIPRLIVAAVLVNLSYFICAIAVDASNIVGDGLQRLLVGIREGIHITNPNYIDSWQSVTGYVLADTAVGGAAAVTIGGVVISSGASLGAALILLLPMLLSLILAVLVALVVLAARQALIIILIIVAPLAFVAYLLPNTEKLFERWRELFVTMLVFFPMFALIFGGSQLAAFFIIQSAHDINVILLAMFVQVAPLVLTPLLVRFSGGVVGRIAGLINDPKKGIVDRTRTWARGQSEYMAARNMARTDPVRRRQVFRRFALTMDQRQRAQQERLSAYKEASDARWTGTQQYSDIQQQLRYAQDSKAEGVDAAGLRYETSKTVTGNVRDLNVRGRDLKLRLENAQSLGDLQWEQNHNPGVVEQRLRSRVLKDQINAVHSTHDAEYEEFKRGRLGHFPATAAVGAMLRQSELDTRLLAINALRTDSAKRSISEQFTKELKQNRERIDGQLLQTYAGGIQGVTGAQRALAAALTAQSNAGAEAIKNATTILSAGNYTDSTITQIALGNAAGTGITITEDMRNAAITKIAGGPNSVEIMNLMQNLDVSGKANSGFAQTFVDALMPNSFKPKFAGAGLMANMKQGIAPVPGTGRLDQFILDTINANKLGGAEAIVSMDSQYLNAVRDAIIRNPSAITPQARAILKSSISMAKTTPQYAGRIAERIDVINQIDSLL